MATFESKEHYYYDALQKIEAMCQEDSMDTPADTKFAIINLIQDIATAALNYEPELHAKCQVCSIYDAQANKQICVKCEGIGFKVGDEIHNENVRKRVMFDLYKDLDYLWDKMTHIERALTTYYRNTHPHISWGMQESGLATAHAVTYDFKSWCGEDGFSYIVANVEQSGLGRCPRCIRLLQENGIEDY